MTVGEAEEALPPLALEPLYRMPSPDSPISLYDGPLTLTLPKAGVTASGPGRLGIKWLPRPQLHFHLEPESEEMLVTLEETESAKLRLVTTADEVPCLVTGISFRSPGPSSYTGIVQRIERRTGEPLVAVRFHVVNFASWGMPIRDAEGRRWRGRNALDGSGWRILLDKLPSVAYKSRPDKSEAEQSPLEREGYEVTHVGSIERADGSPFSVEATPLQCRHARRAARALALAEQVAATIGTDPKASVRRLTALEKVADAQLAALRAAANGRPKAPTLSEYLSRRAAGAAGGTP